MATAVVPSSEAALQVRFKMMTKDSRGRNVRVWSVSMLLSVVPPIFLMTSNMVHIKFDIALLMVVLSWVALYRFGRGFIFSNVKLFIIFSTKRKKKGKKRVVCLIHSTCNCHLISYMVSFSFHLFIVCFPYLNYSCFYGGAQEHLVSFRIKRADGNRLDKG